MHNKKLTLFLTLTLFFIFIWHPPYNTKTLNIYIKLIKLNYHVKNLQNGGCPFLAIYTSNYLDNLNIPHKIITLKNNNIAPQHIMILTPFGYLDNKGLFSNLPVKLWANNDIKEISKSHLIRISNLNIWNKQFNLNDTTTIKNILLN